MALEIGVPPRRINEIVHGKRAITADTALRLARYLERPKLSGWGFRPTMTSRRPGSDWVSGLQPR